MLISNLYLYDGAQWERPQFRGEEEEQKEERGGGGGGGTPSLSDLTQREKANYKHQHCGHLRLRYYSRQKEFAQKFKDLGTKHQWQATHLSHSAIGPNTYHAQPRRKALL